MKKLLSLLLFLCCCPVFADEISIDADFPGGNIVVDSIQDGTVRLRTDLRDSGDWFYYAFRVKNAQGQTLRFVFDRENRIGIRGPAISSDGEKSWRYLSETPDHGSKEFVYSFGPNENSVLFAQAILYTQKDWDAFVAAWKDRPEVRLSTLCKGRKGRDVERMEIVENENAPFGIVLTARHHCCEMTADMVLEGILEEALSDSESGKWLRANARFYVIPFVDKDGVEDGDQGKGRRPHDHNRDYNHERYPEIKALKADIHERFDGKPLFFLDLHCPWLRTGTAEYVHSPLADSSDTNRHPEFFFQSLEKHQAGGKLAFKSSFNLAFGTPWNNKKTFEQLEDGIVTASSTIWVGRLPNTIFSECLEIPYSNASGAVVTRESCRELGHSIARAMADFLKQSSPNH